VSAARRIARRRTRFSNAGEGRWELRVNERLSGQLSPGEPGMARENDLGVSMASSLRRRGSSRVTLVLAALALGIGALVSATGATAGPALTQTIPFSIVLMNTCAGTPAEEFLATGTVRMVESFNVSADGTFLLHTEMSASGAQGVTLLPPFKKYVFVDSQGETATADTPFPAEDTFEWTIQFIRQGEDGTLLPGDDLYFDLRAHFTINANGETTVDFNRSELRCR
jgi:hypothetical protein